MAEIWKGAPVAAQIMEDTAVRAQKLRERGITPALAILRIGEKPDDIYYENAAVRRCEKAGIAVRRVTLPQNTAASELERAIGLLNEDRSVSGILALRPMPGVLDSVALQCMAAEKDVDGITPLSLASVFSGKGAGFAPCTAEACLEILKYYGVQPAGKTVAVIGRSLVIGRPVAMLLMAENATVTICHTGTRNMEEIAGRSDIVIAAAGHIGTLGEKAMAPGQIVIDVGMNDDGNGGFCGDADFAAAQRLCRAVTPVPGGVGTVTTALLLRHVVEAAEKSAAQPQ